MKSVEKNLTIKQVALSARKEIKRRRRECEKIHIPNDIVEEIMVKLPVKSLMRFQTVSKHWRTLIRSRDFKERHMALEKSKGCKLLFVCDDFEERTEDTLFLKTVTLEKTSASVGDEEALEFQGYKKFLEISESCDGLVCFYDIQKAVEVINPATTMFIELPLSRIQQLCTYNPNPEVEMEPVQDPNPVPEPIRSFCQFGFGKDIVYGRYKLVWLYNTSPTTTPTCEVLDLEVKKWRFVNTTCLDHHKILFNERPVFANGSLYWLTGDEEGYPTTQTKLIVFDMHTEMFQVIPTPPFITSAGKIRICNLDGRLCISELKGDCKQDFWWRVDEDNTWERLFSVDLHSTSTWFGGITSQPLIPLTISRVTNQVILSLRYQDNLVALDLDHPNNSSVFHLYFSGSYGLVCPYFPSFALSH